MSLALDLAVLGLAAGIAAASLVAVRRARRAATRTHQAAERAIRAAALASEAARAAREERDHARSRLDAGDARWHALLRGAPLGIVEADETGRVVAANAEALRLLRTRLVGDTMPPDGEHVVAGTEIAVVTRTTWAEGELAFVRDITHERTSDAELRESEARFRRLSETAFEGVAVLVDGKVSECNARFAALLDRTVEETVGARVTNLLAPDSRGALLDAMLLASERPFEVVGARQDGGTVPLEGSLRRVPMHGHDAVLLGVRDITRRRELEVEVARLRGELAVRGRGSRAVS